MSWTNSDGLLVLFGNEQGQLGRGGEYNQLGPTHLTEVAIDLLDLGTTPGSTILTPTVTIPNGAFIEKVIVIVDELTAGTNSNLDLGLIDQDRSTELDYNGLLAAADAWHVATVGTITEYVVGTTEAGALIGTVLTNSGLLTANADTAVFTAGELVVRIYWNMPVTVPNL